MTDDQLDVWEQVAKDESQPWLRFNGPTVLKLIAEVRRLRDRETTHTRCEHRRIHTARQRGFRPRRGCLDCEAWLDPCALDGASVI